MKTSTRNLIGVAVCIVVLGTVATVLMVTGNKEESSSSTASSNSIELVSKKSEDIVSMAVTNQKGSYTLLPKTVVSSSSSSSSGSSGTESTTTYEVKGFTGVPINTSAASQVVQNGFSLVATKNLGTFTDLNQFGLKTPQATVNVTFKDGSTYNYKIGNPSAAESSVYYMCGVNSNNVYIVSIDSGLLEDKNYFVSKDILAITSSSGTNDFTQIALSGTNFPQPITLKKSGTTTQLTAPIAVSTDSTNLNSVETALATLTADSVEAVDPDAAALASYGLDKPAAVAEFTVNKGNYKLMVGKKKSGSYYVMLDKVSAVYLVKAADVDAWVGTSTFALRDKNILLPNIETVKQLTVTVGDTASTLTTTRTKDEAKSTQDKPAYTYKVTNGSKTAIDYSTNYTQFYVSVISIQLLEEANTKPSGKPDISIEYQYFDSKNKDTISLYKNGDRRYTAVMNGSVYGLVTSGDVDKMASNLKLLESGKTVS